MSFTRRVLNDRRQGQRRSAQDTGTPVGLDVYTWLVPQPGKFTKPVFVRVLPDGRKAVYFIKTASGWPFDIKIVDNIGIYDRVTENDSKDSNGQPIGWPGYPHSDPHTFKLYQPQVMFFPRYYDPTQGRIKINSVSSLTYLRYSTSDCTTYTSQTVGAAEFWFSQYSNVSFGGDVGVQNSLVSEYFYTPVPGKTGLYTKRERFYLTQQSGWVMWDFYVSTDGTNWVYSNANCPNKFIPDPYLVPVQPCSIQL